MASPTTANLDIRIEQDQTYHGDDWWSWSIWIEGDNAELDRIERVVYQLHRTFPEPVRTKTARANKFKLEAEGWGVFTIYARVFTHHGEACKLSHELVLNYPDGSATAA